MFTSAVLVSSIVEILPSNSSCGRIHNVNIDFGLAVQKISATGQYFCTQDFQPEHYSTCVTRSKTVFLGAILAS